ncbi:MAG TPA: DNA-processing protein DprA [Sulfurimonas sp.]|uniref:DNA-processing protein DprA n=1 Tax=Sulfurimonas sp. TaxID=2022749 RepID=UPI002C91594F|nr:DNA-processing protein DprA [Sulfurimonas sp.]HUH42033.1 DNA-processing protein DprA [Sulfurimonas sp.]
MSKIEFEIPELLSMKKYPKELFYSGNLSLLDSIKISIVGSRKPTKYSRLFIDKLSSTLSNNGICIVSGGAMGIDATAHIGAGSFNTISVLPCGVDVRYPAVNKNLLNEIEKNGLLLSQVESGSSATPWSFVVRNELVVALGEVLVVGEAEIDSGTMRSVEFALKMGKKIFVLPQRLGESDGTNQLLRDKKAEVIYDIDEFVSRFSTNTTNTPKIKDEFMEFCTTNPTYDEALAKYPQRVFEAELNGDIKIKNGVIIKL